MNAVWIVLQDGEPIAAYPNRVLIEDSIRITYSHTNDQPYIKWGMRDGATEDGVFRFILLPYCDKVDHL